MRARVTSTRFVGRTGELAELEAGLAEAAAGCPVLTLVGGDSGVGKTRLLVEFERRANAIGARVLRGEGIEHGEDELPYAALISALRPLVREGDDVLQAISPASRAELAALLPGLTGEPADVGAMEAVGQLRLFEALLELVGALSADGPLLLVLDDLQWADRSTRTFVSFLVRSLRDESVMLLVAYRSDDLHRRHALRPLLSELSRLERARPMELAPFDLAELAEVLTDILGAPPTSELVRRLHDRAEGNALFTEELLAAGLDGRSPAPPSLRDAFLLRVERLSEPARRALRALAAGQRLDQATLARVTGLADGELNDALREAVDEQILDADAQHLSFRHSLLREAVYDDLLPGERTALHLALARALEQRAGEAQDGDFAAPIAYHYAAAGEQRAALAATVAAARSAYGLHAYGEAADLIERALELWPRVPDAAELLQTDHTQLLSLAADAHELGGDRAREETLREAALAELGPGADPRRRAVLLGLLARAQWSLNRGERALTSAQDALALLPVEASAERAALLAWLARTRALRGKYRRAVDDAREALAVAEAVADLSIQGQALNTLGMALIALGDVEQGAASLRRAYEIARESDDPDAAATASSNLADLLHVAGRTPEALDIAVRGLAEVSPAMRRTHDWMSLTVSELAFESGDWNMARDHLPAASRPHLGRHRIFRDMREAELALGMGQVERAEQILLDLEPLVAASFEPQWHGQHGALLAEVRRRRGDLDGARVAVQDALDRLEVCTDDVMSIARVTAIGLDVEADRAQRARDLHEPADAKDALTRARIHMRRLQAAATEGGPVERAWRARGRAALSRARGRPQPKEWVAAVEAFEAVHRPYEATLARWRQTEAEVESGDRVAAAITAARALADAKRIGAEWVAGELEGLCRRARLDLERNGGTPAGAPPPESPFGLTERERQVLALVAEGATNRQIGAALFMAEKTASVHVSRILAKLDVHSRTQAAAVAHRLHLR